MRTSYNPSSTWLRRLDRVRDSAAGRPRLQPPRLAQRGRLPEDFAQSLAQTQDGYLWIGTSGGLARFDGVSFAVFNRENMLRFLDDSVYSLLVTKDGTLWAGTEGGGLVRYKDGRFRAFGAAEGLTNGFVRVIYEQEQPTLGRDRRRSLSHAE